MAEVFQLDIEHIHFGKFDMGGVLYHANYFHFYEEAREKLLIANSINYNDLVNQGLHIVVLETTQKFIKPIYYAKKYLVKVGVEDLTKATLTFRYNIFCKDNLQQIINTATTKHSLVKKTDDKFTIERFPEYLIKIFNKYKD